MVIIERTYSRIQQISRALVTIGLLLVGFFVLFFATSEKFPRVNEALGGVGTGIAHAEVPTGGDSGCGDSCGSDGDCGCY